MGIIGIVALCVVFYWIFPCSGAYSSAFFWLLWRFLASFWHLFGFFLAFIGYFGLFLAFFIFLILSSGFLANFWLFFGYFFGFF